MKNMDYPAGHSMDSQWFAVDKDGNVGFFDTSSAATMPIQFNTQEIWIEFIERYTTKLSDGLHQLLLPENQIVEIINECSEDTVAKLIEDYEKEKYLFFEGFFQLNEGVCWNDLNLDNVLAKAENDFALLLSEEKQIYYISEVYDIFDEFYLALKTGKIKTCVTAFLNDNIEEYDSKMGNSVLNGYQFEGQDCTEKPYRRLTNPTQPLNIESFAADAQDKIFKFENISFADYPHFQPIEFVPCQSYGFYNESPETGYARVTLSDNKTDVEVAMCLNEWVTLIIENCRRCHDNCNRFDKDIFKPETQSEYPKVIIIQEYQRNRNNLDLRSEIHRNLGVSSNDCYLTNCVKCLKKGEILTKELADYRFSKCIRNLEKEVEIIQPLIIITVDNESFGLLKSQYEIKQSNSFLYDIITINNKPIPIINFLSIKKNDSVETNELRSILNNLLSIERNIQERFRIKSNKD